MGEQWTEQWTEQFGFTWFWRDALTGKAKTLVYGFTPIRAEPEDTDEYRAKARDLGYGDDVGKMCIEHEYLHNWLSHAARDECSRVLYYVAQGMPADDGGCWWEEQLVLEFQRYLNTGEIHGYLRSLEWSVAALRPLEWLADHTYRSLWGINWHNPKEEAHDNGNAVP